MGLAGITAGNDNHTPAAASPVPPLTAALAPRNQEKVVAAPSSEFAGKGWTGTDKLSPKQYADGKPKWFAFANGDGLDIGEQPGNRPIVIPRHVIEGLRRDDVPVVIKYGVGFNHEIRKTFTVRPRKG